MAHIYHHFDLFIIFTILYIIVNMRLYSCRASVAKTILPFVYMIVQKM